MKMKRTVFISVLVFALLAPPCNALTPDQAAALFTQFLPSEVSQAFAADGFTNRLQNPGEELTWKVESHFHFLDLSFSGDSAQYELLAWGGREKAGVWWRLLKTTDGGTTYTVLQDSQQWYRPVESNWGMRLQDLTADGIPEVLLYDGNLEEMQTLTIFAWRAGQLVRISPTDPFMGSSSSSDPSWRNYSWSDFVTNSQVALEDVDGDSKAEVIVYPSQDKVESSPGACDWDWRFITPTQVYKYDGTSYFLWKTIPASDNDPYPVTVPSIAVIHPGTLPLAELSSPGNGDLQVLVSHPAGTNTVDDLVTNAFSYNGTALSFKKRWANQKQPDTTSANWEWGGCPVKQTAPKGQGEWNPSPEDPFLPSPDGKTEYHFVAPYLELRLPRSAVFPYLLQAATAAFTKDPARQTYFIEVPIPGKMKNGKLAAAGAMVCIKKTGSANAPGPLPAPTIPPPAPPEKK